jgi:hypothetical protein
VARGLIQTACTSLGIFFASIGLTISSSKSEVKLLSRKHERPPIMIRIGSHVPPQTRAGIALFFPSNLFYTDGSLMDGVAGFAVHHSIDCNIGFWMRGPTSVFTAELAASDLHYSGPYRNEALGRYLILTDSMSSIRAMQSRQISLHTHPFVYECKQKFWQLTRSGREVSFIWVPVHVGIAGI